MNTKTNPVAPEHLWLAMASLDGAPAEPIVLRQAARPTVENMRQRLVQAGVSEANAHKALLIGQPIPMTAHSRFAQSNQALLNAPLERIAQDSEVEAGQRPALAHEPTYRLSACLHGDMAIIQATPIVDGANASDQGLPQLRVSMEIRNGTPYAYVQNTCFADNSLTIFGEGQEPLLTYARAGAVEQMPARYDASLDAASQRFKDAAQQAPRER